ncbi:hypothetical protein [Mucisphaera sp.]|uniref:hypothetical protein n=1 Tax=Mucisphaera sp. TaxID=2913024 RepID=UPI003D10257E
MSNRLLGSSCFGVFLLLGLSAPADAQVPAGGVFLSYQTTAPSALLNVTFVIGDEEPIRFDGITPGPPVDLLALGTTLHGSLDRVAVEPSTVYYEDPVIMATVCEDAGQAAESPSFMFAPTVGTEPLIFFAIDGSLGSEPETGLDNIFTVVDGLLTTAERRFAVRKLGTNTLDDIFSGAVTQADLAPYSGEVVAYQFVTFTVPTPASLSLLGLGGLLAMMRRRADSARNAA